MNPAQYKKAMRQRALDRRAELERAAEALPQRNLGATHPPDRASSFSQQHGHVQIQHIQVPTLQIHGDDGEGGSAATSFTSAAAGGGSIEGLSEHEQVRRGGKRPGAKVKDVQQVHGCVSGEFRRCIDAVAIFPSGMLHGGRLV